MAVRDGSTKLETSLSALCTKFTERTAHVGIIGLGYVGLPLALLTAQEGFHTTGFDNDPKKSKNSAGARATSSTFRRIVFVLNSRRSAFRQPAILPGLETWMPSLFVFPLPSISTASPTFPLF